MDFTNICSHAIEASSKGRHAAYLLVDGAAQNGKLLTRVYEIAPPDTIHPLFQNTKYESNLLLGPHLIPVKHGDPLLHWYQQEGRDAGLLIFSNHPSAVIISHLQQYLTCILPDDRHKMFRFYDPFIFYYVWPSLTDGERPLFLGPMSTVVCAKPPRENEGEHILFSDLEHNKYVPPPEPQRYPWFISETTYIALNKPSQYALTKMLSKKFQQLYRKSYRILGKERVQAFSERIVQMNEKMGLVYMEDLAVLMGLTSQLGTGFLTDPQYRSVTAAMEKASSPQDKLYGMARELESLKEQSWHDYGKPYYIALKRLYEKTYEELSRPNTSEAVVAGLEEVFPERTRQIGNEAMLEIVALGKQKSQEWGLMPRPGIAISSGILFFLGTGCEQDPLRPWIGDFIKKQMPPEEKTQDLYKTFRRILRFNFRTRQLEPEQEHALWLQRFIEPFHHFKIAARMPQQAQNLTAALLALQPMLCEEIGDFWREYAEETLADEPLRSMSLPMQTLLALVLITEKARLTTDGTYIETDQILDLCRANQSTQAVILLENRLAWLARNITSDLQAEFGGDIL